MKIYEDFDLLKSVRYKDDFTYVSAQGASYIKDTGEKVVDLNEMRVVLGQNNVSYNKALHCAQNGITSLKGKNNYAKERLYQYLDETTNQQFCGVHLTASGSEAIEVAVRLARAKTGRREILSFWNSIHGRTYMSASLSGVSIRKAAQGELEPGVIHMPYPHCAACKIEKKDCCKTQTCHEEKYPCIEMLEIIRHNTSTNNAAAIVVEPIQGNGIIVPPKGFLKQLQQWAHEKGMLFIVDEIQSGMGRTGVMYRYLDEGLEPDILLLGKALGNGQHIAVVLVKDKPEEDVLYALTGGSGEDPVCCAAACEVFRQLNDGLLEHIAETGKILNDGLKKIAHHSQISESRGAGLAAGIEFYDEKVCKVVYKKLTEKGFLVGCIGKTLFFKPPYAIIKEEINAFLKTFSEIMTEWRDEND